MRYHVYTKYADYERPTLMIANSKKDCNQLVKKIIKTIPYGKEADIHIVPSTQDEKR